MTPPTTEEFAAWRENEITQFVLQAVANIAEGQQADWLRASWSDQAPDHDYLIRKRAMAAAYSDLANITLEAALSGHGVEAE